MTRECTGACGRELPLEEFSPKPSGKYGRNARCRACEAENFRRRYHDNPEAYREMSARWVRRNPAQAREMWKRYRRGRKEAA